MFQLSRQRNTQATPVGGRARRDSNATATGEINRFDQWLTLGDELANLDLKPQDEAHLSEMAREAMHAARMVRGSLQGAPSFMSIPSATSMTGGESNDNDSTSSSTHLCIEAN